MKYDPQIHHRRSIRLKGYDYSQSGLYFITICIQNRECLLGKIEQNLMILNPAGEMVKQMWQQLPQRFPHIQIDEFAVMPNHLHGIISMSMVSTIPGNHIQGQYLEQVRPLESNYPKTAGKLPDERPQTTQNRSVKSLLPALLGQLH
jgi:REP element-mobilizing transposase RayT